MEMPSKKVIFISLLVALALYCIFIKKNPAPVMIYSPQSSPQSKK